MLSDTIIAAPFQSAVRLHSLTAASAPTAAPSDADVGRRLFKIRTADSGGRRTSANILVNRMYTWRGYATSGTASVESEDTSRVTLVAVDRDQTIGTISIGFDGRKGLLV